MSNEDIGACDGSSRINLSLYFWISHIRICPCIFLVEGVANSSKALSYINLSTQGINHYYVIG